MVRWADKLRGVIWYAGAELSQAELIKRAFAGDDVQADFEAAKAAEVEEHRLMAEYTQLGDGEISSTACVAIFV